MWKYGSIVVVFAFCCLWFVNVGCSTCSGSAINPPLQPTEIPEATVGQPYEVQFSATGASPDNLTRTLKGKLPQGLTFDSATGKLSGTPTEAGSFSIEVSFTLINHNLCGGASQFGNYTLTVKES